MPVASELGTGVPASEGDEVALPVVDVRRGRRSAQELRDRTCDRGRLEDGHLRELRQGLPLPLEERGVAEGEQVVPTARAERAIDDESLVLRERHARQAGDERMRSHPTGPDDRACPGTLSAPATGPSGRLRDGNKVDNDIVNFGT